MALDQSALLELVDMLKSGDGGELMRRLLTTILQELVDAEATASVPSPTSAPRPARPSATAPATSW